MFKLLRYFSITSLAAMGIVTVLLGIFYRHMALNELLETEESKSIALTQVLANSIWPRFAPFLTSASALDREALRDRPETAELRRAIIEQTKGLSVVKVKIYDLQGLTLFSTEGGQIGEDKSDNAGFLSARSGNVASELTHRNSFSAFDRIIEKRDVFSSYIPVRGDSRSPIEGVFEVYTDLTPFMQRITLTQRTIMVGVVLIQACLFGILFLIVRRADQLIRRHDIERSQKEKQIRDHLRRISALRQINVAVTSTLDIRAVLMVLMEKIAALLPLSTVQVWLLSGKDRELERTACWNLDEEEWKRRSSRGTPPLVQAVIEGKKAVTTANLQTDSRAVNSDFYRKHGLLSYLGVPLIVKEEVLGVLAFFTREERPFPREEIDFLSTLAGQAAMAISNSQLYEETRRQALELERASKTQADFTAMIAHDLRSPLMNIMGAAEMMAEGMFGSVNAEQKRWLLKAQETGRSLVALVSDFLDVSKMEAGCIDLVKEEVDVKELVRSCVENHLPMMRAKNISIADAFCVALPTIKADPGRLGQVLSNLLSNAIKFTDGGGHIEVGVARAREREIRVWVKDDGVGIGPEELVGLFEKYSQSESGKMSKCKGTGLGLVVCKMIVEAHGGQIWVESEEGKGTTVFFSLPCVDSAGTTASRQMAPLEKQLYPS